MTTTSDLVVQIRARRNTFACCKIFFGYNNYIITFVFMNFDVVDFGGVACFMK